MNYEVKLGIDGKNYLVFAHSWNAEDFRRRFEPAIAASGFCFVVSSYGQLENALRMEKVA